MSHELLYILVGSGGAGLTGVLCQVRLYLRDRGELKLARRMFDQSLKTDGMDGYTRLVKERRAAMIRPTARPKQIVRHE